MFIKLNFSTLQNPSIWLDAIYWIMINNQYNRFPAINTGAQNAFQFYQSVLSNTPSPTASTALISGQNYTIASAGTTTWTSVGSANNSIGTAFTATGTASGTGTAYLTSSLIDVANISPGSRYKIASLGTTTTWSNINASLTSPTVATTFTATSAGTGNGKVALVPSVALFNAISSFDYSSSEIINSSLDGSMPFVNYNSSTNTLTIKSDIQDDNLYSQASWLQIGSTTFVNSYTSNTDLTSNSTSSSGSISLGNTSAAQEWNRGGGTAYCFWTYISPTCFTWAHSKAYNSTLGLNQYNKIGWHMSNVTADWTYANERQKGPFINGQYTRLDVWNTSANGIVPVFWNNGYDATYRPYNGLNYDRDFAYQIGSTGNLVNLFKANPRAVSSTNTTFSVMNTLDATPNTTGIWYLYGTTATGALLSASATAGVEVSFGTNIKSFQDHSSLVNNTFNSAVTSSGNLFHGGNTSPTGASSYSGESLSDTTLGVTSGSGISITLSASITYGNLRSVSGTGIPTNTYTIIGQTNTVVYVSQYLTSAPGATLLHAKSTDLSAAFYSPAKSVMTDNAVSTSAWHGIQGASLWDDVQQDGKFYRWPTEAENPTGCFVLQPLVWNRQDFANVGGLMSDKTGIYLFNGDYIAGDEFTVNGTVYSIWPLADGWSHRIGLAVPKR